MDTSSFLISLPLCGSCTKLTNVLSASVPLSVGTDTEWNCCSASLVEGEKKSYQRFQCFLSSGFKGLVARK